MVCKSGAWREGSTARISSDFRETAQETALPVRLAYRVSSFAQICSAMAAPSQNCQCENGPEGMAKVLAQFKSAATRQNASAEAITAAGVSRDATATANRLVRLGTLGRRVKRILTTMALIPNYQLLR